MVKLLSHPPPPLSSAHTASKPCVRHPCRCRCSSSLRILILHLLEVARSPRPNCGLAGRHHFASSAQAVRHHHVLRGSPLCRPPRPPLSFASNFHSHPIACNTVLLHGSTAADGGNRDIRFHEHLVLRDSGKNSLLRGCQEPQSARDGSVFPASPGKHVQAWGSRRVTDRKLRVGPVLGMDWAHLGHSLQEALLYKLLEALHGRVRVAARARTFARLRKRHPRHLCAVASSTRVELRISNLRRRSMMSRLCSF